MTNHIDQQGDESIGVSAGLKRFGINARRLRKLAGMSQDELARRASLHRTYISDIERGQRNLSLISIITLARALEVSIGELCEGVGEQASMQQASEGTAAVD